MWEYNEKYDLTKNNDAEVNTQLADLIKRACEQTGCQVVVLIDEYDAPLPDVLHEEENLPVLRNVMRTADTLYVIELKLNKSVDALFVLEELKQGNLIISNMTIAERQHIFDFLDLVHANFITRLKQEFDLTKNELLLAALLKVGFSNKQLMIVFDCEMKSIYKNRQRLKADLGLTKNDSLEQMVMMY